MKLKDLIQHLLESIPLKQSKNYRKLWNETVRTVMVKDENGKLVQKNITVKDENDRLLFPIFQGKFRIAFDFEGKYSTEEEIERHLATLGYAITDREQYIAGKAKNNKGMKNIGGLLVDKPSLKKAFDEDSIRKATKGKDAKKISTEKLKIIISRHPHDIATMSTDREWKSCMTLAHTNKFNDEKHDDGDFAYKLDHDILNHTLVAYLVTEHDTNIQAPLSRLAIKAYFNKAGHLAFPTIAKKHYGFVPEHKSFYDQVLRILKEFNEKLKVSDGEYTMPDDVYTDGTDQGFTIKNGDVELEEKDFHRFLVNFKNATSPSNKSITEKDRYAVIKKFSSSGEIKYKVMKELLLYIKSQDWFYDRFHLAPLTYFNLNGIQEVFLIDIIMKDDKENYTLDIYKEDYSVEFRKKLKNH